MNKGQIKCVGSASYLKSLFNKGFKLSIRKSYRFNEDIFKNIIELFDQYYKIESNNLNEIVVILNNSHLQNNLQDFLTNIEENKIFIGIDSFSISSTNIEDVFLKYNWTFFNFF